VLGVAKKSPSRDYPGCELQGCITEDARSRGRFAERLDLPGGYPSLIAIVVELDHAPFLTRLEHLHGLSKQNL